MHFII